MKSLTIETVSLLTFPAMLTTEIGVAIANALPSKWLLLSFAGLQIAAIWLMNLKNKLQKHERKAAKIGEDELLVDTSIPREHPLLADLQFMRR